VVVSRANWLEEGWRKKNNVIFRLEDRRNEGCAVVERGCWYSVSEYFFTRCDSRRLSHISQAVYTI
jgi:hypothetical protein